MASPIKTRMPTRQSGVALVLVLWAIVLLTVMAGSFTLSTRRESGLLHTAKQRSQALALAEAGVYYALLAMWQPEKENQWRTNGSLYEFKLKDADIRVQIRSESGKVDINKADEKLLKSLLESIGLEQEEAESIAANILDWRDSDSLIHLNGAEEREYKDADLSYGPRNKKFQSIEELQLVLGVTPKLYQILEPLTTVFARSKGVDPSKASRQVLMALPGATTEIVDEYLLQRAESTQNNTPEPVFPLPTGTQSTNRKSGTVTVTAEATLPGGGSASLTATTNHRRGGNRPFTIVAWNQSVNTQESFKDAQAIATPEME